MLAEPKTYAAAVERATAAAAAYYTSDVELMTDAEYDALLDEIRAFEEDHPDEAIGHELFTAVAAGTSTGGDVEHAFPMLSMEKANTVDELTRFIASVEGPVVVEPKLDGLAMSALYEGGALTRVALRGDGRRGEDVTAQVRRMRPANLPLEVTRTDLFEVRGELVMTEEDFAFSSGERLRWLREKNDRRREDLRKSEDELAKLGFANPRNAVAGSIRRDSEDYAVRASFYAYDLALAEHGGGFDSHLARAAVLSDLGFVPSLSLIEATLGATDALGKVEEFGEQRKAGLPYPTDGIVLKADLDSDRQRLGETSSRPRWSVAFKYPALRATTVLRAIEMGVGRTGNISFTAVFDPVKLDGSTVARATLHNFDYIRQHDLRVGDTVQVWKANDVIPRVEGIPGQPHADGSEPYDPERICPISGEPLDTSGAIWRSHAPEASLGGLIEYACSRDAFDIEGIGESLAIELVESGLVNSVADLFALTEEQIAALPLRDSKTGEHKVVAKTGELRTVGATVAATIAAEIEKAKAQPFNRVITALGIRKAGRTFGRRLAAEFRTADRLIAATEADLMRVEGVSEGRAAVFLDGIARNADVLRRMGELGVNMGEEPSAEETEAKPLAGMKIVVTGAMTGPLAGKSRNEVNELIEAYGGTSSGSVSAATSLLVSSESGTSKAKKAEALGIRIATPEEFAAMLGIGG